jgi:hypothetical protein
LRYQIVKFALLSAVLASGAQGALFSFQGMFSTDDQENIFKFTIASTATVTMKTFGYAGGLNGSAMLISEGGFDPALALFDGTGALIALNNDGTGFVPPDSITGAEFDSYLSESLTAGTYTLVLTESPNTANGPTLADGFANMGQGNFTCALYFGNPSSTQPFCDINPAQRNGKWAVDIAGVNSAVDTSAGVPEPASVAMFLGGAALLAAVRRIRVRGLVK